MEKIALITGATGGIGFATAKVFGRDGYRVLLTEIDDKRAKTWVEVLTSLSPLPILPYVFGQCS